MRIRILLQHIGTVSLIVIMLLSCRQEPVIDSTVYLKEYNPVMLMRIEDWSISKYSNIYVPGCKVKLYNTEVDYQNNINVIDSGYTDNSGQVTFLLDTLPYWYRCEKGCYNNDLFKHCTVFKLQPNRVNWTPAVITGIDKVQFKNHTLLEYYIFSITGRDTNYVSYLPAGNNSVSVQLPSAARSLKLESIPTDQQPQVDKYYAIDLMCNESKTIDIF